MDLTNIKHQIIYEGVNILEEYNYPDQRNVKVICENTTSTGSGAYQSIAYPIIKRTYDHLITRDLVTYHSIDKPVTSVLYFYPKVTQRNNNGDNSQQPSASNDLLNECVGFNCRKEFVSGCTSYYHNLYNDNFYDQSKGEYDIVVGTGETFSFDEESCITDYTAQIDEDGTVRGILFRIRGFEQKELNQGTPYRDGRGFEMDIEEFVTSFKVLNSGTDILDDNGNLIYAQGDEVDYRFVAQKYGNPIANYKDICADNGDLLIEVLLSNPIAPPATQTYDGYIGVNSSVDLTNNFAFSWKRYKSLEFNTQMSEFSFDHKKVNLSVTERQTRANWSLQLQQDLESYQGIKAPTEFVESISQQIALEIDREILRDLKNIAPWVLKFDYLGWRNSDQPYTQELWNKKAMDLINAISGQIHKAAGCGGANWVVLSAEASSLFPQLSVLKPNEELTEEDRHNIGIRRVGTLGGRYDVYIDAFAKPEDILIGCNTKTLLSPGYIFAPYHLAIPSETVTDVNNFSQTKAMLTRCAKKITNSTMYGRIKIDNLPKYFNQLELR